MGDEILLAAAKKDACAASEAGMEKITCTYPEGKERLIVDSIVLPLETKTYLTKATGNKISVEELIVRFAYGLNQGDKRLLDWLRNQK